MKCCIYSIWRNELVLGQMASNHIQYDLHETCVGLKIWWGVAPVSVRLRPPANCICTISPDELGITEGLRVAFKFQYTLLDWICSSLDLFFRSVLANLL